MKATRVVLATLIALMGLTFVLQRAAAEARPHRVYLAMVAAGTNQANRASTSSPNATISVEARAGLSCGEGESVPVRGARITVVTDHSRRVALTDDTGFALFSATSEPAVIQIEWPVGFLPCPNSRPIVELPSGTGEVQFTAITGH